MVSQINPTGNLYMDCLQKVYNNISFPGVIPIRDPPDQKTSEASITMTFPYIGLISSWYIQEREYTLPEL